MSYPEVDTDWREAPEELRAEFQRLADAWYAGWSMKGRDGFKQALWIAFNMNQAPRPEERLTEAEGDILDLWCQYTGGYIGGSEFQDMVCDMISDKLLPKRGSDMNKEP